MTRDEKGRSGYTVQNIAKKGSQRTDSLQREEETQKEIPLPRFVSGRYTDTYHNTRT